jgi:hypothetical protein
MPSEMERGSASTEVHSSVRPGRSEDWLWVLVFAAGVRVFFFASGTPFFTNLDEFLHCDVVQRYRFGQSLDVFAPPPMETRRLGLRYNSPEFVSPPSIARPSSPNWMNPNLEETPEFKAAMRVAGGFTNHEARSPPRLLRLPGRLAVGGRAPRRRRPLAPLLVATPQRPRGDASRVDGVPLHADLVSESTRGALERRDPRRGHAARRLLLVEPGRPVRGAVLRRASLAADREQEDALARDGDGCGRPDCSRRPDESDQRDPPRPDGARDPPRCLASVGALRSAAAPSIGRALRRCGWPPRFPSRPG